MSADIPEVVAGLALVGENLDLAPLEITIEHGIITRIDDAARVPDLWICPALFNAHTHLGDTIAMDRTTTGDLETLVTPPHGLKHRLLAAAPETRLISGMRSSIRLMTGRGTAGCADFREGGVQGVRALKKAAAGYQFHTMIFGREGGETEADGLGVSSVRDIPDAGPTVAAAKQAGKLVAIHAGEKDAEDIDAALSFNPDLIIHATHATDAQLKRIAELDIPVAVCPRSNWTFSVTGSAKRPPVRRMLDLGCRVFLGTDNVMFVQPDMFAEMAFLQTVYRIDPHDVLQMAVAGSSLAGEPFFLNIGAHANFFLINPRQSNLSFSNNPVASIVKRGFSVTIGKNVFNP